jgi:RNA polymerase sigma-70 factor (ECF subfamily)
MAQDEQHRNRLYEQAVAAHGAALARLARAVEADPERARDLEQDVHLALWRSLADYDGRCALGTWTYRVAHNIAASHGREGARAVRLVGLDEAEGIAGDADPERETGEAHALARLRLLIAALTPPDRSVILLWLEGLDARAIAEVTGLSPNNVAVKTHRIRALLAREFEDGDPQ